MRMKVPSKVLVNLGTASREALGLFGKGQFLSGFLSLDKAFHVPHRSRRGEDPWPRLMGC